MNRIYIMIGIVFLVAVIAIMMTMSPAPVHEYMPFTWDGDKCITYYKNCTCTGELFIAESYPMQYFCQGTEVCCDINITECRE